MSDMETLAAILIDDEPLARSAMRKRLEMVGGVKIVGEAKNGREGLSLIRDQKPDVVFLDIRMPGLDGLEVARELEGDSAPLVVFVTAFDQFAIKAFERNAVDYLLKPVDPDRLQETMARLRLRWKDKDAHSEAERMRGVLSDLGYDQDGAPKFAQRIAIRDRGVTSVVECADIDWVEAAGDYVCIHVGKETHILRETMKNIAERLDPATFKRVHRSAIVNLNRVKELTAGEDGAARIVLASGSSLRLGRSYRGDVREALAAHGRD